MVADPMIQHARAVHEVACDLAQLALPASKRGSMSAYDMVMRTTAIIDVVLPLVAAAELHPVDWHTHGMIEVRRHMQSLAECIGAWKADGADTSAVAQLAQDMLDAVDAWEAAITHRRAAGEPRMEVA